jgi:hypothetical protein
MTEATLSPEFLARMDEAIAEEFERSSRLRKILPAEVDMPHARYGVVIPRVEDDAGNASAKVTTDVLRPPITLSREVKIAARQLEDLDLVLNLVRDATKRVCVVEDQVIAYGGLLWGQIKGYAASQRLQGVCIRGLLRRTEGLMGPGTSLKPAFPTPLVEADSTKGGKRGKTLRAIIQNAVSKLDQGTPAFAAPYAAALGPRAWTDYVPSDEDFDKHAIHAALQSKKIAVVNGPALSTGVDSGIDRPKVGFAAGGEMKAMLDRAKSATLSSLESARGQTDAVLRKVKAAVSGLFAGANPGDPELLKKLELQFTPLLHIETEAFLSVFSGDPLDLDLARVRRPWGSARGYDNEGNLRIVIESQFLLRVKRGEAIFPVWVTDQDADGVAEVQHLPIRVSD